MAVLAHCWLIIECYLIPDGFIKWFFLSFYINPFFLFFCQIFLWVNTLKRWIFLIIFLLNRYVFSRVLGVSSGFLIIKRSSSGSGDTNAEPEDEDTWHEVTNSFSFSDTTPGILFLGYESSFESPKIISYEVHFESVDQETVSLYSTSDVDEDITSFSGASSPISSYSFPSHSDVEVIASTPSFIVLEDQEATNHDGTEEEESDSNKLEQFTDTPTPLLVVKPDEEEEKDSFYKSYTERMRWFDLLNQERTSGQNAFLSITKKQFMGGDKRILKSLESDFEMVYVAQSCLSWEALHYEYRKLDRIIISCADTAYTSPPYGALCSGTLANKFQRFQILLERYMEDERCEKGKRYWNFIQKRSSLKSLLQVPNISDYAVWFATHCFKMDDVIATRVRAMRSSVGSSGGVTGAWQALTIQLSLSKNVDVYKEGNNDGLMIRATDMLKKIENCMKTFKSFVELDDKKPWWRARSHFSWKRSPLEDPRDFNLLHNLTRTLRQKELWLKDLYGKQKCWLRKRVKVMEINEKKEMMFAMIELKLVSRVLMMSVISTAQLQWCQQKLDNIIISNGRITRSSCTVPSLFPPS